jgi:sulfate adenylyltransferase subunit 1
MIKEVDYKMNINTMEHNTEDKQIKMNDIACITIKTSKPIFFDPYNKNRYTGSLILIDEATNETVGAGMIL